MSYEAWGEPEDNYWTDDQLSEKEAEAFVQGLRAAREFIFRALPWAEQSDRMRRLWNAEWGDDPGPIDGDIPTGPD